MSSATLCFGRTSGIKWLCESRVNPLPKELMRHMAKAGCRWLYLGCESGSQRILDIVNKQIRVEDIRNVVNWGHEPRDQILHLMDCGSPG